MTHYLSNYCSSVDEVLRISCKHFNLSWFKELSHGSTHLKRRHFNWKLLKRISATHVYTFHCFHTIKQLRQSCVCNAGLKLLAQTKSSSQAVKYLKVTILNFWSIFMITLKYRLTSSIIFKSFGKKLINNWTFAKP